jgi:excisionase family DNA binding protein
MDASDQRALRPSEFCKRYSVGRTKLYQLIEDGELAVRKSGKATLIDAQEAERWFEALPKGVSGLGAARRTAA